MKSETKRRIGIEGIWMVSSVLASLVLITLSLSVNWNSLTVEYNQSDTYWLISIWPLLLLLSMAVYSILIAVRVFLDATPVKLQTLGISLLGLLLLLTFTVEWNRLDFLAEYMPRNDAWTLVPPHSESNKNELIEYNQSLQYSPLGLAFKGLQFSLLLAFIILSLGIKRNNSSL